MISIPLPNGRDLGGLPIRGGSIRPGVLLRSAAPVDDAAASALQQLGVGTVVDLRTDRERQQQPSLLPAQVQTVVADMLADATQAGAANIGRLAAQALGSHTVAAEFANRDLRETMLNSYRDFATLDSGRRATASVIRLLADPCSGPVLIHCTAGKDRTGWIVAVLLRLLGAEQDVMLADYLASGPPVLALFDRFTETLPEPDRAREVLAPVLGVEAAYLAAAFDSATGSHGSFENFVRDGLELDESIVAAVRARLLQIS